MGHYEIDVLNDGHGFCLTTEAVTQFPQSAMAKFVIAGNFRWNIVLIILSIIE